MSGPKIVALGGGHGLAASLSALRDLTDQLTAIVTVADDGGSSGRLRDEFGVLPPGDLRMALAALCSGDQWGQTWAEVLQHRFQSAGDLDGHSVGNLLLVALGEITHDPVEALDWVGRLLQAEGRVLPMASVPLELVAEVSGLDPIHPENLTRVRGQVAVAATPGAVRRVEVVPDNPPVPEEAVRAILDADWVVIGPGSWYSSVVPHLLVAGIRQALLDTKARIWVNVNLVDQPGETEGLTPGEHLRILLRHAPNLHADVVLADPKTVAAFTSVGASTEKLAGNADALGARLVLRDLARDDARDQHDVAKLRAAYAAEILGV